MAIFFLFSLFQMLFIQRNAGSTENPLGVPDYESSWIQVRSQIYGKSDVTVKHKLGEVPLLVDVQVKTLEDPNKGFIFPGIGGCPRDDDLPEFYGGVIYIYNDKHVIVSSPVRSNDYATGSAIYVANDTYFVGPNNQTGHDVLIRVRAWKGSSLPAPDFSKLDIKVLGGAFDVNKVYVEEGHGLGEYPGLVRVRAELLNGDLVGFMSDGIGASLVSFTIDPTSKTQFFIHGFDKQNVRVWISSVKNGRIFQGSDGYKIWTKATLGRLEIYAWKTKTLPASIKNSTQLGPNIIDENFEMPFVRTESDMYVQVWAESLSGPNAGYRFPGSGALAYAESIQDPTCTYGGLVYGYSRDMVRFWRPTDTVNAGLICIGSLFAQEINTQLAVDANIVVSVWTSVKSGGTPEWQEIENTCTHIEL